MAQTSEPTKGSRIVPKGLSGGSPPPYRLGSWRKTPGVSGGRILGGSPILSDEKRCNICRGKTGVCRRRGQEGHLAPLSGMRLQIFAPDQPLILGNVLTTGLSTSSPDWHNTPSRSPSNKSRASPVKRSSGRGYTDYGFGDTCAGCAGKGRAHVCGKPKDKAKPKPVGVARKKLKTIAATNFFGGEIVSTPSSSQAPQITSLSQVASTSES